MENAYGTLEVLHFPSTREASKQHLVMQHDDLSKEEHLFTTLLLI